MAEVAVRVPATTANLGPGFDCLALALDLWNEAHFSLAGEGVKVEVTGLGAGRLPTDENNLIAQAALRFFDAAGRPRPKGLRIGCQNRIPLGSGLGSSAAAVLMGLLGANALLGSTADQAELLGMATEMEGHPDNAAAALYGGLVLVTGLESGPLARSLPLAPLQTVVATPEFDLPTHAARAALPAQVALPDAVYNIGRTALVVEALRTGDLELLGKTMDDRLHQPYRFRLIPGASEAAAAARRAGAAATALSGAGPSVIAFGRGDMAPVAEAMVRAFQAAGLRAQGRILAVSPVGASR